ncbi:hypothetical protein GCM10018954_074630 [Kutzneria kofuensis]
MCARRRGGGANTPDLGPLTAAITTVRDRLRPGQLVVVESTTHPSTTDGLLLPILEQSGLRAGVDFNLAYSPERIDPGNQRFGITTTPRVVGGLTAVCTERAAALYRQVTEVHVAKGIREAEAAKILENTYRQVNIALVNEFAQLCHGMDIDVWDVIEAASTKPYGFKTFWPGAGVGGHCIPADPLYLVHHAASLACPSSWPRSPTRSTRACRSGSPTGSSRTCPTAACGWTGRPCCWWASRTSRTPPTPGTARPARSPGSCRNGACGWCSTTRWSTSSPGRAGASSRWPTWPPRWPRPTRPPLLQRHQVLDLDLVCDHARRLFDTTGAATTAAIKL